MGKTARRLTPSEFIRTHTRIVPVRSVPEIRLHAAHEATGLWRLAGSVSDDADPPPPYWAFPWAGGLALARHILDGPEAVRGKHVLDLGAGSGLVAIAAALSGALRVTAADVDPYAVAAIPLNAAANGVAVDVIATDLLDGPAPEADIVTVGDLFYERALAVRVTAFLDRCMASGVEILVGDPGRAYLPTERLVAIAEYAVPDVGDVEGSAENTAKVYRLV